MKQDKILFKAGTVIEMSFARIKEDQESKLFGQYFPMVMPILNELGGQSLGSFTVTESYSKLNQPHMCALFQWPSLEAFEALHKDPRFLDIKGIRDEALEFLSNGHFFEVKENTEVSFFKGQSYFLSATNYSSNYVQNTEENQQENDTIITFNLIQESNQNFKISHAKISNFNKENKRIPEDKEAKNNVFKIIRNFPL